MSVELVTSWEGVVSRASKIGFPIKILGPHGPIGLGKIDSLAKLKKKEARIREYLKNQTSATKGIQVLKCNY